MIDLTKLTFEEANKIECALIQLENHIKEVAQSWEQLSHDTTFTERFRNNSKSNAEWWKEVHTLIYGEEI